jgi:E3 ubiquitin-protein ligase RNF14
LCPRIRAACMQCAGTMCMTRSANNVQEQASARKLRQALKDEALVRQESKPCPHCGAAISKTQGCNKVVCALCKGAMCWLCCVAIEGYEHFRAASCRLVDAEQALEWEMQWQRMLAAQNADAERARGDALPALRIHGMRCRQCAQFCPKVARNNHIKCAWCRADCCFVCRSLLRGKAAVKGHFGVNKCPQHS